MVSFGADGLFSGEDDCFFLSSGLATFGDFLVDVVEGGGGAFLTGVGLERGDFEEDDNVPTLPSF